MYWIIICILDWDNILFYCFKTRLNWWWKVTIYLYYEKKFLSILIKYNKIIKQVIKLICVCINELFIWPSYFI